MKHPAWIRQVTLCETASLESAQVKEKRFPSDLLPTLPRLEPSDRLKSTGLDSPNQPLGWINKESIQQLDSLIQVLENYEERLEEQYFKQEVEANSPETKQQLQREFISSKKAAKDMLNKLRQELHKKVSELRTQSESLQAQIAALTSSQLQIASQFAALHAQLN